MTPHARVSVNPMCMWHDPYEKEVATFRDLGVRTVGVQSRKMLDHGWQQAADLFRAADLDVAYVAHPVVATADDVDGWRREEDTWLRLIDDCVELGSRLIYFTSGPPGQLTWNEAVDALAARMERIVAHARDAGVALAVENTVSSRPELGFVFSLRDAVRLARTVGIGVCADMYCCWIEPDLAQVLRESMDVIRLVQASDFVIGTLSQPNRWVPGDGDLPLERLLADVRDAGYTGLYDLELLGPAIDEQGHAEAVRRGVAWMSGTLTRLGVR